MARATRCRITLPRTESCPPRNTRKPQSVLMSKIVPILMILGIALAGVWIANNVDAVGNLVGKRAK